jgi:hypothetical protein
MFLGIHRHRILPAKKNIFAFIEKRKHMTDLYGHAFAKGSGLARYGLLLQETFGIVVFLNWTRATSGPKESAASVVVAAGRLYYERAL